MTDELARAVDRMQRSRAARSAREAERWLTARANTVPTGGALEAGARVFDTVTGQEGTIIGANRQNVIHYSANGRND